MLSPDAPRPRWPRYGLRADPFFSNPLDPENPEVSVRPITLFRGRAPERRRLVQSAQDGDHSATLIHAAGGYGKTTLANAAAYDLAQSGFLIVPEEIQFVPERGALGVFYGVLHGVLQGLSDVDLLPKDLGKGKAIDKDYPALSQARQLVDTIRVRSGWSLGAGVATISGQISQQYKYLKPAFEPVASRRLLEQLSVEVRSLDTKIPGIVLRLNNLDVALLHHKESVSEALDQIRDVLQTDGYHFFFMGSDAVQDMIAAAPRVEGVFETPISLGPFTEADVQEILDARYEHLSIPGKVLRKPVANDLVSALHDAHYGDLRNILRDLRRAVQEIDPVEARPVVRDEALPSIERFHFERLQGTLKGEHWQTLDALDAAGDSARQKDIAERLGVTEATISTRFRKLTAIGAVDLFRTEGRSLYWRLGGNIRLALKAARAQGVVDFATTSFTDMTRDEKLALIDRCMNAVDITRNDSRATEPRCKHAYALLYQLRDWVMKDERIDGGLRDQIAAALRDVKDMKGHDEIPKRRPFLEELERSLAS